jgi:hypothetical protein
MAVIGKATLVAAAMVATLSVASSARAEGATNTATASEIGGLITRPHTIAELEAGIIALPTAPISSGQRGGDTPLGTIGKGDATVLAGMHLLYRASQAVGIGAGFLLGPSPTSDTQYGGLSGLPRTHARSYLLLGTEFRYIPYHSKSIEAWVGLTAGGVVISDRFTTESAARVPSILGTREVTVRTEGFSFGLEAGASWLFTDRWVAGLHLRADRWILPNDKQCTPIGDCATLTGSVEAFQLGLTIGYRLPL